MPRHISEQRKTAYYVGTALQVIGILLFLSTFVSFAMQFGNFDDFESRARSGMFRAFGGVALLVVGGIVRGIGARGLAGSGVVLDPHRARQELEPYSRMAGGMIEDALDEADVDLNDRPTTIVKIKCQACGALNEERAKFCQQCGKEL